MVSVRENGRAHTLTEIAEKPDLEFARERLVVDGIEENCFLAFFGQYVLKPRIFDYLGENIACNLREHGEFQLTSAIARLRQTGVNRSAGIESDLNDLRRSRVSAEAVP